MDKVKEWLSTTAFAKYKISIASSDASFRKYYRLVKEEKTFIVMDSSLELKSLKPFVGITSRLSSVGVNVPQIYAQNLELGYLVLEDLGKTNLLDVLDNTNFKRLYKKAIEEIVKIQKADTNGLAIYDKAFLDFEMGLMQEWYLEKKLSHKLTHKLTHKQKDIIENSLKNISCVVLSQPQDIFVHRDFHSRNIMITNKQTLGVIDYQDAMNGALTYDLVSLLKDCYISYNKNDIDELALYFKDKVTPDTSDKEFLKWFDFMGLQRHIKVLGIFSRLSLRDGKDNYLKDIPLTLHYTIQTAERYEETKELAHLLKGLAL
jgi:hypothetical protein